MPLGEGDPAALVLRALVPRALVVRALVARVIIVLDILDVRDIVIVIVLDGGLGLDFWAAWTMPRTLRISSTAAVP